MADAGKIRENLRDSLADMQQATSRILLVDGNMYPQIPSAEDVFGWINELSAAEIYIQSAYAALGRARTELKQLRGAA